MTTALLSASTSHWQWPSRLRTRTAISTGLVLLAFVCLGVGGALLKVRHTMQVAPADAARLIELVERAEVYHYDVQSAQLLTGALLGPTSLSVTGSGLSVTKQTIQGAYVVVTAGSDSVGGKGHQGAGLNGASVSSASPSTITTPFVVYAARPAISSAVSREGAVYRVTFRQEWGRTPCSYDGIGAAQICPLLTRPYYWQLIYHLHGAVVGRGDFSSNALPQ